MPSGNQTLHWEIPSSFVEKLMIFLLITQGFFSHPPMQVMLHLSCMMMGDCN